MHNLMNTLEYLWNIVSKISFILLPCNTLPQPSKILLISFIHKLSDISESVAWKCLVREVYDSR